MAKWFWPSRNRRRRAAWRAAGAWLIFLALATPGCRPEPAAKGALKARVEVQGNQATVHAEVTGFNLGLDTHLHLSLNDGPEVMQYSPSYTFRNLPSGSYRVRVGLADNRTHRPIPGVEQVLTFEIP